MGVPMNQQDYERFLKLADVLARYPEVEIKIYVSKLSDKSIETKDYVSIEMVGSVLHNEIVAVFE